jgi:hypothetical protein
MKIRTFCAETRGEVPRRKMDVRGTWLYNSFPPSGTPCVPLENVLSDFISVGFKIVLTTCGLTSGPLRREEWPITSAYLELKSMSFELGNQVFDANLSRNQSLSCLILSREESDHGKTDPTARSEKEKGRGENTRPVGTDMDLISL